MCFGVLSRLLLELVCKMEAMVSLNSQVEGGRRKTVKHVIDFFPIFLIWDWSTGTPHFLRGNVSVKSFHCKFVFIYV